MARPDVNASRGVIDEPNNPRFIIEYDSGPMHLSLERIEALPRRGLPLPDVTNRC